MSQSYRLPPICMIITIHDAIYSIKRRQLLHPGLHHTQRVSSPRMSNLHLRSGAEVLRRII